MQKIKFIFQSTPFRSGATLLSRMLNAHPKIGSLNDDVKFFRFCYNRYLPLNKKNVHRMLEEEAYRLLHRFNIKLDVNKCFEVIKKYPLKHDIIYKTILLHLFKNRPKDFILDKETLAWTKIPLFLEWFPNSKALLIIRDLRDVVVSFKKLTFAPGNDYLIALFNVIDAMDTFLELQHKFPHRFYGVRYEMLKSNPKSEMKKISHFLGIDYSANMLNEKKWVEFNGEKWINKKHSTFYTSGDYQNPVGRWRRLITEEELFLCEWIGKKQMQNFGIKFEGSKISQKTFNRAIQMLTSSNVLRECFQHWCETGKGMEAFT